MNINKEIVGIASWDMGQKNQEGRYYSDIDPLFYTEYLAYILNEYKYRSIASEWQIEAYYHDDDNKSWGKLSDSELYKIDNFQYFLLKNIFWSVHLRAYGCDISSVHNGHRVWAVNEHKKGIDFAFAKGLNAITFHPGSYNERINYEDKNIKFKVSWDEAIKTHNERKEALKISIKEIIQYYVSKIVSHETQINDFIESNDESVSALKWIFQKLQQGRINNKKPLSDVDEITLMSRAFEFINLNQIPIKIVRRLLLPQIRPQLCIENVEPYNFLLNLPGQLETWYEYILEIYYLECKNQKLPQDFVKLYRPKIIIDCNHFINSQMILKKNPQLESIFGAHYEECNIPFAETIGTYDQEPLLNGIIRRRKDDILYWHLSGLYDNSEYLLTHEPIKSFRKKLETTTINNELFFKYQLGNHTSINESNLETIIQTIGYDQTFILEIFNTASENIKNSWENVTSFLKYLKKLRNHAEKIVHNQNPDLDLSDSRFAEIPVGNGKCGIKEFIFYKYTNEKPFYKITARISDDGKISVNNQFQG